MMCNPAVWGGKRQANEQRTFDNGRMRLRAEKRSARVKIISPGTCPRVRNVPE